MKKKNLIWLAVGAVALYLVFRPKGSKSVLKNGSPDSVDTKGDGKGTGPIAGPTGAQVKAAAMTNDQLKSWYCRPKLGGPGYVIRKSAEEIATDQAVEAEMKKRGLDNSCPGGSVGIKK